MNETFMKEKPVLPLILSMTLPMVLSMLVNSLYNIIDSFFVAQIGFFRNVHFIQDSD